jgi:hypothetical protein
MERTRKIDGEKLMDSQSQNKDETRKVEVTDS